MATNTSTEADFWAKTEDNWFEGRYDNATTVNVEAALVVPDTPGRFERVDERVGFLWGTFGPDDEYRHFSGAGDITNEVAVVIHSALKQRYGAQWDIDPAEIEVQSMDFYVRNYARSYEPWTAKTEAEVSEE